MAQEKAHTVAKKEAKEAKATEPKLKRIAELVFDRANKGVEFKSREAMVLDIVAEFKRIGQTHTIKGKELTLANVGTLISALTKDVVTQRKGKWSGYKVVKDDETGFQLAKR